MQIASSACGSLHLEGGTEVPKEKSCGRWRQIPSRYPYTLIPTYMDIRRAVSTFDQEARTLLKTASVLNQANLPAPAPWSALNDYVNPGDPTSTTSATAKSTERVSSGLEQRFENCCSFAAFCFKCHSILKQEETFPVPAQLRMVRNPDHFWRFYEAIQVRLSAISCGCRFRSAVESI